jgi:hypothetical protein
MRNIFFLFLFVQLSLSAQTSSRNAPALYFGELEAEALQNQAYYEEYAFLGIYSEKVSREKARILGFDNPYGSYVSSVIPGTAADKAGILPLDYLYGIDEYRTGGNQNFTEIIRKFSPGDKVNLYLMRKGQKKRLPVTFGTRNDIEEREKRDKCEEPFFGISSQSWDTRQVVGIPVNIVQNSTAKSIGMQDGDIITHINGYRMVDWKDVTIAIDNMNVGDQISVTFVRYSNTMEVAGAIKSYCETKKLDREDWDIAQRAVPEPGDWFSRYFEDEGGQGPAMAFRSVSISIQDIDKEDTRRIGREKGINFHQGPALSVKNLSISADANDTHFDLSFYLPQEAKTVVKVYNEASREIYNYDLGTYQGQFEDKVEINQNGDGTYYLEIIHGGQSVVKMVSIAKG